MIDKKLVITCRCDGACGSGFEFILLDDEIYVSTLSNDWYSIQNGILDGFLDTYKEYLKRKKGKINIIKECITSREDILSVLNFLEECFPNLKDVNEETNYGILTCSKEDVFETGEYVYAFELRSVEKSTKDIFLTKRHRKFNLVLTKKEASYLIKRCKEVLEED